MEQAPAAYGAVATPFHNRSNENSVNPHHSFKSIILPHPCDEHIQSKMMVCPDPLHFSSQNASFPAEPEGANIRSPNISPVSPDNSPVAGITTGTASGTGSDVGKVVINSNNSGAQTHLTKRKQPEASSAHTDSSSAATFPDDVDASLPVPVDSEIDSDSEEDEKEFVPPIPLPDLNEAPKSKTPMFDLLRKLEQDNLASPEALSALRESPSDPTRLLRVLQEWSQRDEQGARPHNFTEFQCLQPDTVAYPNAKQTSFKLSNLVLMLGDELPVMREYLVQSFQHGFDLRVNTSVPITRRKYKNPKQTPEEEMSLTLSVESDFSLGYLYHATGREIDLILNSVFCVPKRQFGQNIPGKHRRVTHPKYANEATDPEDSAITYATVLEAAQAAVAMRDQTGRSVRFSKYDCKHAFYLCPLKPCQIPLMGFEWQGQKYVFGRVPFGVRCGSRLFSSVALTINWLLKHVFMCEITISYCDDFLLIASSEENCETLSAIFELVMQLLGVPLQGDKIEIAQPEIVFLGTEMDAESETLDLPAPRKELLKKILAMWQARDTVQLKTLRSLTGTLNFVCRTCPQGGLFLRRLYGTIASFEKRGYSDSATYTISSEMRKDLTWWSEIAPHIEKMSMRVINQPFTRTIYSDASDFGGAAFDQNVYFQTKWENEFEFMRKDVACINLREFFTAVQAAATWGHTWSGDRVRFKCDNMSAVLAVLAGKSKNIVIMHYLRVLALLGAMYRFTYFFEHISGVKNVIADFFSREEEEKIKIQYPHFVRVPAIWLPRVTDEHWESAAIRTWQQQLFEKKQE
jgi:hypothetical protein